MTATLDLSHLAKPILSEAPTGNDLRMQGSVNWLYYKIKDARAAARAVERQRMRGEDPTVKADWRTVFDLSVQALSCHSKDLEIASWLLEAALRIHGFAGLYAGISLLRKLIDLYWDSLYPLPDDDGLITRLAPLTGLNGEETEGTLIVAIAVVPLTQGSSVGPFSLWQYQQATDLLKVADPEKRKQRIAAGVTTLEMITQAVAETSLQFMQQQRHDLRSCIEEYKILIASLDEKAGTEAPPSSRILAQLNACLDCMDALSHSNPPDKIAAATLSSTEELKIENSKLDIVDADLNFAPANNPTIQDLQKARVQILKSLTHAAAFFRRAEPHSPISYLLERAIKWSQVPLPELLKELIKDQQAQEYFCNLTGVELQSLSEGFDGR